MILRGSGGTDGWVDGWNVTLKERLYSYLVHTHTHIHLGMIELHADFFFSMARQVSLYLPIKRNEVRLIKESKRRDSGKRVREHTASTQTEKQTDLTSFYYLSIIYLNSASR